MTQAARKKSAPASAPAAKPAQPAKAAAGRGRRIQVRNSGVHGRGVYALAPIKAGEVIIEYTGELISWD